MNARVREKHEVPVVAQETKTLDELKADVRELRAADAALKLKVDVLEAKVDAIKDKVEVVHLSLLEKIESLQEHVDEKFSKLSNDVAGLGGFPSAALSLIPIVLSIVSLVITTLLVMAS